jgi:phospholipid/cholesterol/gamma-HCH transport system ATP-binding protein
MSEAKHVIEFDGVSKSFLLPEGGEQKVLDGVSFFVPSGETVAILGRSGVGKSVTLKHIIGFLQPDEGRVLINGEDSRDFDDERWAEIRRKMAMVFQSGALFDSLTVAENVAFPLLERARQNGQALEEEEVERRVHDLLETVELEEKADAMPSELSMGMRRAVAIARALAAEPDCILYDEPTTMVDPLMAQTITDLIERLKEKYHKTAIVVTHDVRLAERVADRMVMLHQGKVAFFGTPEEWQASREPEVEQFRALDAMPGSGAISSAGSG